jgi:hypothetical protein
MLLPIWCSNGPSGPGTEAALVRYTIASNKPAFWRSRIERFFSWIKQYRRVATRLLALCSLRQSGCGGALMRPRPSLARLSSYAGSLGNGRPRAVGEPHRVNEGVLGFARLDMIGNVHLASRSSEADFEDLRVVRIIPDYANSIAAVNSKLDRPAFCLDGSAAPSPQSRTTVGLWERQLRQR